MIDSFAGGRTGLVIPAHPDALRGAGAEFLTAAFRAFGSLAADNAVAGITRLEHCPGGSTGQKMFLTVEYDQPDPALNTELFVKFSRDFTDERRDDPGRFEMQSEVPFMWLARQADFPIAVARPYFADFDDESGTGLIVTERIAYGEGQIEPHRRKTLDHQTLDDPLAHYRAVVKALARLSAAHKSGALGAGIDAVFPFDPVTGSADPIRYDEAGLQAELDRCFAFARQAPQLLPAELRSEEFLAQMARDSFFIRENERRVQRHLTGNADLRALCHWNAHIDNCFFTDDPDEGLQCGFIDWGRAGQITFGSVLWGGLSAAHHDIWDYHMGELLALFVDEYRSHGGPAITALQLEDHLTLHVAAMGVARVLAFPEVIRFRLPECVNATGPLDAMFEPVDPARNCLRVYTNYLKFWQRQDFGSAVARQVGG